MGGECGEGAVAVGAVAAVSAGAQVVVLGQQ